MQRPQSSIQRGVVHGQSCGCTASFKCQIHSRQLCGCNGAFKCQTHAKQACGCSRDFKCHAHALSSSMSSCGCSGAFKCQAHGRQLCGCSGSFKCHAHGKQSCGCSGSFKCHAHGKQSCGCSGAFKCQIHSSQACGCRGALLCKAHATEQFSCTEVKQTSRRDVLNVAGMIGSAILLRYSFSMLASVKLIKLGVVMIHAGRCDGTEGLAARFHSIFMLARHSRDLCSEGDWFQAVATHPTIVIMKRDGSLVDWRCRSARIQFNCTLTCQIGKHWCKDAKKPLRTISLKLWVVSSLPDKRHLILLF